MQFIHRARAFAIQWYATWLVFLTTFGIGLSTLAVLLLIMKAFLTGWREFIYDLKGSWGEVGGDIKKVFKSFRYSDWKLGRSNAY